MGMDAKVDIWAGVKFEDTAEWQKFRDQLPSDFLDENGFLLEDDELEELTGFKLNRFFSGDQVCGFGVSVYDHDWDYGVVKFPVDEVLSLSTKGLAFIRDLTAEFVGKQDIGVWCQTDYR